MGVAGVVEPEYERVAPLGGQVADLRIIAVDGQRGLRRKCAHCLAPTLGDQLELAVPVELVAKEVPERDRMRP
jgi:hypothetical protein